MEYYKIIKKCHVLFNLSHHNCRFSGPWFSSMGMRGLQVAYCASFNINLGFYTFIIYPFIFKYSFQPFITHRSNSANDLIRDVKWVFRMCVQHFLYMICDYIGISSQKKCPGHRNAGGFFFYSF